MPKYLGHILTDDVVVNYKNADRDECLHFLTHIDTSCHNLASIVSPTAKKIYTSSFNAWCLKMNFDVKHMDIQGFDTNKSYKITYKGNKYIYSFIDSKFTTGSVALLLHGTFGSYLYTGNFCYHPGFVKSPVLLPVIKEKALTRLYLDNMYYEQPSNFLGFDEIAFKVVENNRNDPMKFFYIYAEKITMDPLIAEIASRLEEKVYVCQSTLEIMKILGFESFFTRLSYKSRVFINKTIIKTKDFEQNNVTIYLNRFSDSCKSFQKIEKKGSVYNFNFYCHSNHKELCELLRILKPESMTFLFSEIEYDFSRTVVLKGVSAKQSVNVGGATNKAVKKIPRQLISSKIINDNTVNVSRDLGSKRIIIPKNQSLLKLKTNEGAINLAPSTSGNPDVTRLHSTEYKCPLRILKVPEINNVELSNKPSTSRENGINNYAENSTFINEVNLNYSIETNDSDKNSSNSDIQSCSSLESFHNYHELKQKQLSKFIKLKGDNSVRKTLIPSETKTFSPYIVQTKAGMPFIFNPKLVKENGLNGENSKFMQISDIRMLSDGQKKTILVKRRYVEVNKPCLITVPPDDNQKTKQNCVENLTNNSIMMLENKTFDTDSNIKEPSDLNSSKIVHDLSVNDSVFTPNNSLQILENNLNEPEESISYETEIGNKESIELEAPGNSTIDEDKDSNTSGDSINLRVGPSNQSSEILFEFRPQDDQQTFNEESSGDDSTITTLETFVVDKKTSGSSKLNNDPDLNNETLEKNGNEFFENNGQVAADDNSPIISKRCLSDYENEQPNKKLRSENLSQSILQSNILQKENISLQNCSVLIKPNSFNRSYFYSSRFDCYLPKFFGFKKHEVRPRHLSIYLRNLKKLLKN
ncbi:unnamed protein product [Nezara viridula]|uniref:Uncharacterized protein n=1 Tax=Nezara viridula TaxID=85310 RepID=A0A9P0MW40_NEZVI|nr:unnamed protein product [Nezara viridula]